MYKEGDLNSTIYFLAFKNFSRFILEFKTFTETEGRGSGCRWEITNVLYMYANPLKVYVENICFSYLMLDLADGTYTITKTEEKINLLLVTNGRQTHFRFNFHEC